MIKVGPHDAYLATPPAHATKRQEAGILYVPDVIGIYENSQLLADEFAAVGYTTLIIDLFSGDAIPLNRFAATDLMDWIKNGYQGAGGHTTKEIDPIIVEAVAYMRDTLGLKHIGAAGYCFGAKYVVRGYRSGIDVGFIAHPSFVEDDELAFVTGPLSIAAAETDAIFPKENRFKTEEILKSQGTVYQISVYSHVDHGFAVRRSLEKKVQRVARDQAAKQAIDFFNAWLV